jgi:hypothetical protein
MNFNRMGNILQIKSCDNHTNLFTMLLHLTIFDKSVKVIGVRRLKYLKGLGGRIPIDDPAKMHCIVLFFIYEFYENFS